MKRFKVGDKVIALTNPLSKASQPRIKGSIYEVKEVIFCSKCGEQVINLGFETQNIMFHHTECGNKQHTLGLYWTASKYFAKVDEFDEALEEAIQNEDYELACLLRDLKSIIKDYARS